MPISKARAARLARLIREHYPGGEDHDQSDHGNWASGPTDGLAGERLAQAKAVTGPLVQKFVGAGGRVEAVPGPITDHPTMVHLAGQRPRGWQGGSWEDVAGAYDRGGRLAVLSGAGGTDSSSASVGAHEVGHGVDQGSSPGWSSRADRFRVAADAWREPGVPNPHFAQAGDAGYEEIYAEAIASYTEGGEDRVRAEFGDEVASFILDLIQWAKASTSRKVWGIAEHYGPGAHPSGSGQESHGNWADGRGGERDGGPNRLHSRDPEDGQAGGGSGATPRPPEDPRGENLEAARRWALGVSGGAGGVESFMRAYSAHIDALTEAFQAESPEMQERLLAWDERAATSFDTLDLDPGYEEWIRTVVPGFFDGDAPTQPQLPTFHGPVEDTSWIPDFLYHGSSAAASVLTQGIHVGPAADIVDDAFVYSLVDLGLEADEGGEFDPIEWAPYVEDWYRGLDEGARERLLREEGVRTKEDLGRLSLLWTFDRPSADYSRPDSPYLVLSPRRIEGLLGAFEAEEAGKGEVVLVLSGRGPQSTSGAVVGVVHPRDRSIASRSPSDWTQGVMDLDDTGAEEGGP